MRGKKNDFTCELLLKAKLRAMVCWLGNALYVSLFVCFLFGCSSFWLLLFCCVSYCLLFLCVISPFVLSFLLLDWTNQHQILASVLLFSVLSRFVFFRFSFHPQTFNFCYLDLILKLYIYIYIFIYLFF